MRILLATDGSDFSKEAAAQCGKLTATLDSVVVKIITVSDNFTPIVTEPFISQAEFMVSIERELREKAERIVLDAEKIVRSFNENIEVETEVIVGTAAKIIVRSAEKWNADLIVLGSHGYGLWERALLGSVSDAVVHQAPCSVLLVRMREDTEPK